MAERVTRLVTCDLCEAEAAFPGVLVVVGKQERVIDLCSQHGNALIDGMRPIMEAGRKPARLGAVKRRASHQPTSEAGEIRAWAREQGISIPTRGRIPASVRERWMARAA